MPDNMLIEQAYSPMPPAARRLRRLLIAVGIAMALSQVAYVAIFTFNQPWADEWEFIPVLCGKGSTRDFLWAQHNEHRMPLPREIWLALFQLTGDFRTGSYLQVAIYTAIAFLGMRWAAQLRGGPSWADLFFPLSLLHLGHSENLLMGYQLCFALASAFVFLLIRIALKATDDNRIRTAFLASLLSAALCLCGGFGAVFSIPAMLWIWFLLVRPHRSESGGTVSPCATFTGGHRPPAFGQRIVIALFALFPVVYLRFYFQDYHRPEGHPPFEMKNWFAAAQVTMEVIAVGFGIAVEWIWLAVFLGILGVSLAVANAAIRGGRKHSGEWPSIAGVVAVCLGVCGLALAIGAGRSGFGDSFGLWPRYSILTWPLLASLYFAALVWGMPWLRAVPGAFAVFALVLLPVNTMYGIGNGRHHAEWLGAIEKDVQNDILEELIVKQHLDGTGQEERALRGIPLLRARGIGPFHQ